MHSQPKSPSRVERLVDALLRDRQSVPNSAKTAPTCLVCGRSYASGSRFCCAHCREAFDAGFPVYAPLDADKFYSLPKASVGFRINCKSCGQPFDSCGWNCCCIECSREHRRRQDLEEELKDSPFRTIKRKCAVCGGDIPNWRKGRRVSKATKFCSPRCKDRHGKSTRTAPDSPKPVLARETAKKPPENGLRRKGDAAPSPSAEAAP
jgi:hypothetical protein